MCFRSGSGQGIRAIVVYPMNALANSQDEELGKFLCKGYPEGRPPVRFARYTGQERGAVREAIRDEPPDVLLTNYMMLELLLTRSEDRALVRAAQGLRFLVFDELHTYRGRQGADVAMLIRRCRHALGNRAASGEGVTLDDSVVCIGTSATMASGGGSEDQRREVAKVSQSLFGVDFTPGQVIGETLERATPEIDPADPAIRNAIRKAVVSDEEPPADYESFRAHPFASWIESTFGVREEAGAGKPRQTDAPQARRGWRVDRARPWRAGRRSPAVRRVGARGARGRRIAASRAGERCRCAIATGGCEVRGHRAATMRRSAPPMAPPRLRPLSERIQPLFESSPSGCINS